jgi:enterochelin esterase-like enzyme
MNNLVSKMSDPKILRKGTLDSLLIELEKLPTVDKKGYIEDWLIHFSPNNPLFEENEDPDMVTGTIFVKEKTNDQWKNLFLVGDSFGWDEPRHCFQKIKNTNWWYTSFLRPKGSKLHYLLSPNELGTLITQLDREERRKNWFFDTRNKQNIETTDRVHSITQFPGYQDTIRISKSLPNLQTIRLPRRLEGNRTIKIGTITKDDRNPINMILLHDGDDMVRYMNATRQLQYGVDNDLWDPMMVVSLSISEEERLKEYGGKEGYPDFIAETVIPTVEELTSYSFKPTNRTIVGTSISAWGAFDVVWKRNDVIKNVICHSAPWWWSDDNSKFYITQIDTSKKAKIGKIYLDCGIYETGRKPLSTYDSNKEVTSILHNKKYNYMAREFLMGHRYDSWAWAFPGALNYIFNDETEYGPLPGREMNIAKESEK